MQFSDTTTYNGLVQLYEREIGVLRGTVSGNEDKLKEFTADVNNALNTFTEIAVKSSGTWQWDDNNQTNYPIIRTNVISGQRDYPVTTDQGGSFVLDFFKVLLADSSGKFKEIKPVDVQSQGGTSGFWDGNNTQGTPTQYDKTANGIFLDPIPNYNMRLVEEGVAGLEVYINRTASYFAYTDTTKVAGIPAIFHSYLFLKPASDYARRKTLANRQDIENQVVKMEGAPGLLGSIENYFASRIKDERARLTVTGDSNK